jgi:hypothetical protein
MAWQALQATPPVAQQIAGLRFVLRHRQGLGPVATAHISQLSRSTRGPALSSGRDLLLGFAHSLGLTSRLHCQPVGLDDCQSSLPLQDGQQQFPKSCFEKQPSDNHWFLPPMVMFLL